MPLTLHNSFAQVALITYSLGALAHSGVILLQQPGTTMPGVVHWIVLLLSGYAGIGFVLYWKKMAFIGLWDQVIYSLVTLHLLSSAVMHAYSILAQTNDSLAVFDLSYSYFALAYFAFFGWYCWQLNRRLKGV